MLVRNVDVVLIECLFSPVNQTVTNWAILYVLVFSVLRTFSAALVASSVSEDSKRPMYEMFSVPSESYGAEASLTAIYFDNVPKPLSYEQIKCINKLTGMFVMPEEGDFAAANFTI